MIDVVRVAKRAFTSGLFSAARMALSSLSTTSFGVPAGAVTAMMVSSETPPPGKASSIVGTSGAAALRARAEMATARIRFWLIWATPLPMSTIATFTWPPARSVSACGMPR